MSETLHLEDLAVEMGLQKEQLIKTLLANAMPHDLRGRGIYVITEEVADQLRLIYRNAARPHQVPRPTPERYREGFTVDEQHELLQQYIESYGPTRGDRP